MTNQLFRKIAIERLASPDQLDQLLQITKPRGWVALAGTWALLLVALVWGVFGRINNRVQAEGILLRSGGVLEIVAPSGGRVTEMSVQVGDSVRQGQVIGRIAQPELSDELQQATDHLAAARAAYQQTVQFAAGDAELFARNVTQQRDNLVASIAATQTQGKSLAQRLDAESQLLKQGLIAAPTLLATREQYEQSLERVRALRDELQKLDLVALEAHSRREATVRDADVKQRDAERELGRLRLRLDSSTQIVSMYSGRVLEIMTETGTITTRGEPLLTLDRVGTSTHDLVAVIYVPATLGKRVQRGMLVQIAPSTVRREEFGMMLGTVTFVSGFPATNRGMQRVLKNDQLIQQLSGGGAPYEVHAALVQDPRTVSHYRWTSANGPPTRVESGTLADATIIVGRQMPLSMVLPIFGSAHGS